MEVLQLRLFCRICRVECGECVSDVTFFLQLFVAGSLLLLICSVECKGF